MVDMVLSHNRRGHRGKITVLSSRGLLSLQHRQVNPFPLVAEEVPFGAELPELTAWLRTLARTITSEGGDWRSAIDGLRPHTQSSMAVNVARPKATLSAPRPCLLGRSPSSHGARGRHASRRPSRDRPA